MAVQRIQLQVNSIDGEFQEFPPTLELRCDEILPIGTQVIKDYNENYDIVAKRLFLFRSKGRTFGTFQFSSVADFTTKIEALCTCCSGCTSSVFTMFSCDFTLFGCQLTYGNP